VNLQIKTIKKLCNQSGYIPESCWQYSGQEHATPGFERKKLAQLLEDSAKDIFDAVIVDERNRLIKTVAVFIYISLTRLVGRLLMKPKVFWGTFKASCQCLRKRIKKYLSMDLIQDQIAKK